MANTERARKLLIRSALVTSSTIATLIGAQNFAMLDARTLQFSGNGPDDTQNSESGAASEQPEQAIVIATLAATIVPVSELSTPAPDVILAAPSITILRRAGEVDASQLELARAGSAEQQVAVAPVANSAIQPPAPVALSVPEPVYVQGEAPPPIVIQEPAPPPVYVQAPSSGGGGGGGSSRASAPAPAPQPSASS